MERVLTELACSRASAHLATQETNAKRVIIAFSKIMLFSVARLCFCIQISTNVRLCLARTKERASMELTNSRVSA